MAQTRTITAGDHRARLIAAAASAALADGDRAAMLAALAAIDPNGCWLDAESAADGLPPATAAEAAAALSAMLSNP